MKSQSRSHFIGPALVAVLMLSLSACLPPTLNADSPSPNPAPTATSGSSTAAPTAVVPTAQQPAGPAGPAAPQAEAPVVRWVPVGPVGPNDPTSGQRYLLLQQFQCDALAQSVKDDPDAAVWQAAAAVCKALQSDNQQDWLKASAAVAATPRVPQTQCLESTVVATSAAVLAQHRSNPTLPLKAATAPGLACPRHLTGLTVVDEKLTPQAGTTRASGPRSGGTIVRLDGYYVRVGDLLFDGQPASPEFIFSYGGDYQPMYVKIPPSAGSDTLRISVTDTVDISGTVTFFYDEGRPPATAPATNPASPGAGSPTEPGPSPSISASREASPSASP